MPESGCFHAASDRRSSMDVRHIPTARRSSTITAPHETVISCESVELLRIAGAHENCLVSESLQETAWERASAILNFIRTAVRDLTDAASGYLYRRRLR